MMKTLLFGTMVLVLMVSVSLADPVNPYTPDLLTIQGMGFAWNGGGTTSSGLTTSNVGSAIRFGSTMQSGDGSSDGWASMGLGYPWPTSPPVDNLSAFDGYGLMFLNTNQSHWFVNVYMNTGWTDGPWLETDQFYQSTWVELLPNQTTIVMLDFAAAGVVNENHVTNIGFQVGGNMDAYPQGILTNPSNPDHWQIDVSPVPVPAAVLLGMLGLSVAGIKLRKYA